MPLKIERDLEFLDSLIQKAVEKKCEIHIEITPENETITISPWEAFSYMCPYRREA